MTPKVSVIVPFYNGFPYLLDAARSLAAQTLADLEILYIDDGSDDGSGVFADVLAAHDARVRVFHQPHRGVSAARNAGLDAARGDYIAFLDADDTVDPDIYQSMLTAAESAGAEIVHAGYALTDAHGNIRETVPPVFATDRLSDAEGIKNAAAAMHANGCFLFVWRNLFSRRLIEEHRLRFDEGIAVGEDTLFNMACFLRADRVWGLDISACRHRVHPHSTMKKPYNPALTDSLARQYAQKQALAREFLAPLQYEAFRLDTARYTLTALLPLMLKNLYRSPEPDKKAALKALAIQPLVSDSLKVPGAAPRLSKSLDSLLPRLLKAGFYGAANRVCGKVWG